MGITMPPTNSVNRNPSLSIVWAKNRTTNITCKSISLCTLNTSFIECDQTYKKISKTWMHL